MTRRTFGRLALGGAAGCAWLGDARAAAAQIATHTQGKSQRFAGVEIGAISYCFRQIGYEPETVARGMKFLGLRVLELEQAFFEVALGAPRDPTGGGQPAGVGTVPAGGPFGRAAVAPAVSGNGRGSQTNESAVAAVRADLKRWRLSPPWDKVRAMRTLYADAGVDVRFVKFPQLGGPEMSDDEVNYCFAFAKAMGARGLTCEPPLSSAKRVARFADAHKMIVGFHNHSNVTSVEAFGRTGAWEQSFFYSPQMYANVDIGHFTAGNGFPPTDFIREYHQRISNLHLKDRKTGNGPNVRWGDGDTPIAATLQLLKREQYDFPAMIELEYRIPDDSTVMDELARCVRFCETALA